MFDRLSPEYIRGYTKAIQDIQKVFDYIQDDLVFYKKRLNHKLAKELLQTCLDNREKLRDDWDGFIRYNSKIETFEYYEPNRDKK